eukprot:gene25898-11573_t
MSFLNSLSFKRSPSKKEDSKAPKAASSKSDAQQRSEPAPSQFQSQTQSFGKQPWVGDASQASQAGQSNWTPAPKVSPSPLLAAASQISQAHALAKLWGVPAESVFGSSPGASSPSHIRSPSPPGSGLGIAHGMDRRSNSSARASASASTTSDTPNLTGGSEPLATSGSNASGAHNLFGHYTGAAATGAYASNSSTSDASNSFGGSEPMATLVSNTRDTHNLFRGTAATNPSAPNEAHNLFRGAAAIRASASAPNASPTSPLSTAASPTSPIRGSTSRGGSRQPSMPPIVDYPEFERDPSDEAAGGLGRFGWPGGPGGLGAGAAGGPGGFWGPGGLGTATPMIGPSPWGSASAAAVLPPQQPTIGQSPWGSVSAATVLPPQHHNPEPASLGQAPWSSTSVQQTAWNSTAAPQATWSSTAVPQTAQWGTAAMLQAQNATGVASTSAGWGVVREAIQSDQLQPGSGSPRGSGNTTFPDKSLDYFNRLDQ